MKAIEILHTTHGEKITPKYWHFFKEHKLGRVKEKKEDSSQKLF